VKGQLKIPRETKKKRHHFRGDSAGEVAEGPTMAIGLKRGRTAIRKAAFGREVLSEDRDTKQKKPVTKLCGPGGGETGTQEPMGPLYSHDKNPLHRQRMGGNGGKEVKTRESPKNKKGEGKKARGEWGMTG